VRKKEASLLLPSLLRKEERRRARNLLSVPERKEIRLDGQPHNSLSGRLRDGSDLEYSLLSSLPVMHRPGVLPLLFSPRNGITRPRQPPLPPFPPEWDNEAKTAPSSRSPL